MADKMTEPVTKQISSKGSAQPSAKTSAEASSKGSAMPAATPAEATLETSSQDMTTPNTAMQASSPPHDDMPEQSADASATEEMASSAEPKSTPEMAESEGEGGSGSPPQESDSTMAPDVSDSQMITTSIVTTASTEKSSIKKRRGMSKIEAANVYVYGHVEEPWQRRDIKPSSDADVTVRLNRAHTMRHSCIMKRTKDLVRDTCGRKVKPKDMKRDSKPAENKRTESTSGEDDDEGSLPITARKVPQNIYDVPKVAIKETKASKFRYLYNRKPPGVKVYFKPASADPKKKPPFAVAAHP